MNETYNKTKEVKLSEVYELHKQYTGERRSKYVWEWQYGAKNPHPSVLVGIENNNTLVASQGMYSIKLNTRNGIELTGKNESLLIDKDSQGKGLSKVLYDFALEEYQKENISCLWGFSKKVLFFQKTGFYVYKNSIKRTILSLNFGKVLSLANKKDLSFKKKTVNFISTLIGTIFSKAFFLLAKFKYANVKSSGYELLNSIKAPDDLLKLYKNLRNKYPNFIHIHQDNDFYKWRVIDSPIKISSIFLYENNDLVGYCYLTPFENYTEITDLTFLNNSHGKILIKEIIKFITKKKIDVLYYYFNSKNKLNIRVCSFLNKIGFINIKGPNHFVLKDFTHAKSDMFFNFENWYINNLWSEGI